VGVDRRSINVALPCCEKREQARLAKYARNRYNAIETPVLLSPTGVDAQRKFPFQVGKGRPASASRTGRRSMGTFSPTQIIVFLNPENEEHTRYLLSESFTSTALTLVNTQEEQVTDPGLCGTRRN